MRIVHLGQVPHLLPVLRDWYVAEWAPWYGPSGDGDAASDLAAATAPDRTPLVVVAVDDDGAPLGTAALRDTSVGAEHVEGPWLAAVLVRPAWRRRGIATALIAFVENEARRLGFSSVATSTDILVPLLERRGWHRIAASESLRGAVDVFVLELKSRA